MINSTDITLTQRGVAADSKAVGDAIDNISHIVGDTPVSVQLSIALDKMAEKKHTHGEYAMHDEVEDLKRKIDMLINLVGDVSVSEQINSAISNIR